jgi:hypothetical protein
VPVGRPYNVAVAEGTTDQYFAEDVRETTLELRRLSSGASPLDLLRLELDDAWPGGCRRLTAASDKQQHHAGLPRVTLGPTRWREGYIHVDELAPVKPAAGLFSANLYLKIPPDNSLELWPLHFRNRLEFYRNAHSLADLVTLNDQDAQDRLRRKLGPPVLVTPEAGDLVIISVQRPHAVQGFQDSAYARASLQSFIHFQNDNPLRLEA